MSSLSLTQQQKLQVKLSPAQIQMIRLLEIPVAELQERIDEELQKNPMLEEAAETENDENLNEEEIYANEIEKEEYENPLQNEDFNYEDYVQDDEIPDYKTTINNASADDERREVPLVESVSLSEYLESQIYLTSMDERECHIAKFIVGNIDDDGYLRRSVENLIDDLAFRESLVVSEEEMHKIIRQIQQFDPPGVGATTLQECLLIQLQQMPQTPMIVLSKKIIANYFNDFSHKNIAHLVTKLNVTEEKIREACEIIFRLTPKPGYAWTGMAYERHQNIIIPDFVVENREGRLYLSLNNGDLPQLCVNKEYEDMLREMLANEQKKNEQEKEAIRFVRNNIDSARNFIEAIKQRNDTLLKTMTAIMHFQENFFLGGDDRFIKPMILQDIADLTGFDVSTISRVSNSKYVQTDFGIFPLKYFFSEGMTNKHGDEVSTREIKQTLKKIIANEDKKRPLNDDALVEIMKSKGYLIARRTIAKYRKLLDIPIASVRKRM